MIKRKQSLIFIAGMLLLAVFAFNSCKKEPGIGGDASIKGNIHVRHYNTTFTQFISEYPGSDIYVYIIYGDNDGYGTRQKTIYNGNFEFKYLYPGKYTVYTYSLDSTLTTPNKNNLIPVVREVEITGKKQEVDLGTIEIFD
jgi:hypothetical protein